VKISVFLIEPSSTSIERNGISMKKALILLILLVVSAVALSACVSQAPPAVSPSTVPSPTPALTTVRVAYLPIISNGPLFIAQEEGYFARQGINVEFVKFQSAPASLPALINGDIAVSGGQVSSGLVNAIMKGANLRIVADKGRASSGFCTTNGIVVRRELFESGKVTKISDLKGKKIMFTNDQSYLVSLLLERGNLTPDDVEIVNMDFASGVVALTNGAVDAGDLTEPFITQVNNSGAAVMLIPTNEYCPDWPLPLFYGPAFLDRDPELGRRFMVAYLQGVRQYNQGKTERNLVILENYTHLDRDILKQSCWMPVADNGDIPKKPVREYVDWMYATKKITQNPTDEQLFDLSYVTYANGILVNTTSGG
jgi:NitT/TauT family transport system substrate-binding protein